MFGFNLKVPFPGNVISFSQLFLNYYYYKGKKLTFVTIASLGGLRKVQERLNSFLVNLKSQGKVPKNKNKKKRKKKILHALHTVGIQ